MLLFWNFEKNPGLNTLMPRSCISAQQLLQLSLFCFSLSHEYLDSRFTLLSPKMIQIVRSYFEKDQTYVYPVKPNLKSIPPTFFFYQIIPPTFKLIEVLHHLFSFTKFVKIPSFLHYNRIILISISSLNQVLTQKYKTNQSIHQSKGTCPEKAKTVRSAGAHTMCISMLLPHV